MKGPLFWQAWVAVGAVAVMAAFGGTATHVTADLGSRVVGADVVAESVRLRAPDGVALAGTLTRPARPGPHPAVVLVSGSGPHDRDASFSGHRPFGVLAGALSRAGFAVLRLDDRGVGDSGGRTEETTIDMRRSDAALAVAHLRGRGDVDVQRVGMIGHSEGATVAALVAAEADLAFLVSLAGPGLSGRELSPIQVAEVLRATGAYPAATVRALVRAQQNIVDVIAAGGDRAEVTETVHAGLRIWNALQPRADRLTPAQLAARAERDGELVASPWFRSYVQTDPSRAWRAVSCPVLALNGTRDVQVTADVNLGALRRALRHNPHLVTRALPGLNHMFQPARTGLASEYGSIDRAIDERVVELVVSFAVARVSRHPS